MLAFISVILLITTLISTAFSFRILQNSKGKDAEDETFKQKLKEESQAKLKEEIQQQKDRLSQKNELVISKMKLDLEKDLQQEEKILRTRMLDLEEEINKKEAQLDVKLKRAEDKLGSLEAEKKELDAIKQKLRENKIKLQDKQKEVEEIEADLGNKLKIKLEEVAGLKQQEAQKRILDEAEESLGNDLLDLQRKIVTDAEERANIKAREIVAMAIQRCSSEVANEITITSIKLENDDDKGKIIGKQGRNIQWIEKTLGVELIIDETPNIVTISGFSSLRRNIAKKTLEKLLFDGRVHPSSIEENYEKARAEIANEIATVGEETVNDLGIYDFPAKLVRLIGRMQYRTSYGQNMLKHSIEMAKLAGLLADEMNENFPHSRNQVDRMICVKGALLHDIGKAIDEETNPKGDHVELGEKICDMFGLDWRIKRCISSHHNENYYDKEHGFCIEAVLVDACDNISGGRPGARKETLEAYFQRLYGMEKIAKAAPGVTEAWVMRGSREIWTFFDTEKVTPVKMHRINRQIAKDISNSITAPFKIKVVGFFEDRAVDFTS